MSLEQWYEIWGDHLITTSNLALNRAWLARLPNIQTGEDFITIENFDYALTLQQVSLFAPEIALKLGSLELCKRFPKPCDPGAAARLGHLEIVKWIGPEWPNYRLCQIAAENGHRHIVDWIIELGRAELTMIIGAAAHSPEMLQYVWDRWPNRISTENAHFSNALCQSALPNQQTWALVQSKGFKFYPSLLNVSILGVCVENELLDEFEYFINQGIKPEKYLYDNAKSLAAVKLIAKYLKPSKLSAWSGNKDILSWVSQFCPVKRAWEVCRTVDMANFLAKLCPPTQVRQITNLEMLQWFERNYPNAINYNSLYSHSILEYNPRLANYVREKIQPNSKHLLHALITENTAQLEWILQHSGVPIDLPHLLWAESLGSWKIAHQYQLYKVPLDFAPEGFESAEWLRATGQLVLQ